jgi:hypothetical protein
MTKKIKKTTKKTATKKKVWKKPYEWYVEELGILFEEFTLAFEHNTPPKIVKELKDLMEEYARDSDSWPIDAINMAINEWLEGERI